MAQPPKPPKNGRDAADDLFTASEDSSQDLDVLANDKKTISLYSLNQTTPFAAQAEAQTQLGASIKIINGTIHYDTSNSLAIEALAAGETATDTFQYATIDKQGNISWATG